MKVSVIIPTYNRAQVLCESLDSVLAQTYKDFEVIVVDDGSTDDTSEKIKSYLTDTRFRYVKQENAGAAAARNFGVSLAKGEVISFLDSDDLWKSDKLECEEIFLKNHPDVSVVFTDMELFSQDESATTFMETYKVFSKILKGLSFSGVVVLEQRDMFLCLLQEVPVTTSAFSVRREIFKKAGMFDETFVSGEDWKLFLNLSETYKFGYIDRPLAIRRISEDSLYHTDEEQGCIRIIQLLDSKKKFYKDDPEVLTIIRNGESKLYKHLGWHFYRQRGRYADAFKTCILGFLKTHNLELFLRAPAVYIPRSVIAMAKYVLVAKRSV